MSTRIPHLHLILLLLYTEQFILVTVGNAKDYLGYNARDPIARDPIARDLIHKAHVYPKAS